MSIYSSRGIAQYGYFGTALGAFGASAFDVFMGGPGFQGADTYNNWTGTSRWAISADVVDIGYTPLSNSVLNAAAKTWAAIDQSLNPADADFKDKQLAVMKAAIASADSLAANHSITGDYNRSTTASMINSFKQIQKSVKLLAAYHIQPQPAEDPNVAPTSSGGGALTSSRSASTSAGSPSMHDDPVGHGSSVKSDNTMLYVGLGLGAVALIAGGIFFMKRSKKVSGYGRRHKRRRR